MKIQTRILLFTTVLVILLTAGVTLFTVKLEQTTVSFNTKRYIDDTYFKLYIPEGFSDVKKRSNGGWDIQEFWLGKGGYFQFAKSQSENPDFNSLCKRYFRIENEPDKNKILFRSNEGLTFFKLATVIENGAYVLRKTDKQSQVICFFTINESLYWLMLSTRSSLDSNRQLFNNIVKRIEFNAGITISDHFSKTADDSLMESYFLIYQPVYFFVLIPLPILLLVFFILSAVSKRMGNLPSDAEITSRLIFSRSHLEFGIKSSVQFQIFQGALGISTSNLTVYKFRKPFIEVPFTYLKQHPAEIKNGFLGASYICIQAESSHAVKGKFFALAKPFELRIYTSDPVTVLSYIQ